MCLVWNYLLKSAIHSSRIHEISALPMIKSSDRFRTTQFGNKTIKTRFPFRGNCGPQRLRALIDLPSAIPFPLVTQVGLSYVNLLAARGQFPLHVHVVKY
jgi:hypothetical protein